MRLGSAAHATYARWHQTVSDFAASYRALIDSVLGAAPLKLVFVTQELDPGHAVLAQTVDLVGRSRSPRRRACDRRSRRRLGRGPGECRRPHVRGRREARPRLAVRTLAERVAGRRRRRARPHGPAVRGSRGAGGAGSAVCRSASGTRTGTPERHCALQRASSTSSSASTAPASRSRLRSCAGSATRSTSSALRASPPSRHSGPLRLLALGRTARWKGLTTLLDAVSLAAGRGADVHLEIRGPSLTEDERAHRLEFERRVANDESLRARVTVLPPVPREEIPALIASVDVVVSPNEPRSGATLDKAVFEAAACGRPVAVDESCVRLAARRPLAAAARAPSEP